MSRYAGVPARGRDRCAHRRTSMHLSIPQAPQGVRAGSPTSTRPRPSDHPSLPGLLLGSRLFRRRRQERPIPTPTTELSWGSLLERRDCHQRRRDGPAIRPVNDWRCGLRAEDLMTCASGPVTRVRSAPFYVSRDRFTAKYFDAARSARRGPRGLRRRRSTDLGADIRGKPVRAGIPARAESRWSWGVGRLGLRVVRRGQSNQVITARGAGLVAHWLQHPVSPRSTSETGVLLQGRGAVVLGPVPGRVLKGVEVAPVLPSAAVVDVDACVSRDVAAPCLDGEGVRAGPHC